LTQVTLSLSQITQGLLFNDPDFPDGSRWSSSTITYSIPTATSVWNGYNTSTGEPFNASYSILTAQEATQFRAAVAIWDSYIAVSLVEVPDNASGSGAIRVAFTDTNLATTSTSTNWGYAFYPTNTNGRFTPINGDIWIDASHAGEPLTGYNLEATLHELGHTLGLEHPFSEDKTVNYLPDAYQNRQYTIMSYTDTSQTASNYVTWNLVNGRPTSSQQSVYVSTPMVLDIAAVQAVYGADPNTNKGDTTWSFQGAGDVYLNGVKDAAWPYIRTIYDAAGTDTFDLTQMTRASTVDLHPGAYSSIGLFTVIDQVAYYKALYPSYSWSSAQFSTREYTGENNLGISFSTTIEKIKLSDFGDTVFGNDAGDTITDGKGADHIVAGAGNDTIYSLAGADTVSAGDGADVVTILSPSSNPTKSVIDGGPGIDTLVILTDPTVGDTFNLANFLASHTAQIQGFEVYQITAGSGSDTLTGDSGDNLFRGNGGADIIDGQGGLDTALYAGAAAQYGVSVAGGTVTIADKTAARDGTDTLVNVEQARFTDYTVVFDLHSGQDLVVYKLYQAAFARTPDNGGFRFWANAADAQNLSAQQLADAFLAAPEFAQRYGAAPSDTALVTAMYANVLQRAPDPGGLDFWTTALAHGEAHDQLLVDFAQSAENATLVGAHVSNGYWTT
jgi:serralysin